MKIDPLTPDTQVLAEFGLRLARLRKALGYSQDRLAAEAGVGVATLRRIEAGQEAQFGNWIKLLRVLDRFAALDRLVPETFESPMAEVLGPRRRAGRREAGGTVRWGDEST